MTTMNNEDPADPSVHEQRDMPEPAAWRVYFPDEQREEFASSLDDLLDDLTNCAHDDPEPLYTADQMREAIAAERGRGAKPPKWWTCQTHGDAQPNAWGCPECVREMRSRSAAASGALALEVLAIASFGTLLNGDAVNTPMRMWAEGWARRLAEKEQPK